MNYTNSQEENLYFNDKNRNATRETYTELGNDNNFENNNGFAALNHHVIMFFVLLCRRDIFE